MPLSAVRWPLAAAIVVDLVLVTGYLDFLSYVELVIVAETSRNIVWREDQRTTDRTVTLFIRFGGKMKDDGQNR